MKTQKYDVRAIPLAKPSQPNFLVCSKDGKLIMRRDENGDFILFADDQDIIVDISKENARDFALWILTSN